MARAGAPPIGPAARLRQARGLAVGARVWRHVPRRQLTLPAVCELGYGDRAALGRGARSAASHPDLGQTVRRRRAAGR